MSKVDIRGVSVKVFEQFFRTARRQFPGIVNRTENRYLAAWPQVLGHCWLSCNAPLHRACAAARLPATCVPPTALIMLPPPSHLLVPAAAAFGSEGWGMGVAGGYAILQRAHGLIVLQLFALSRRLPKGDRVTGKKCLASITMFALLAKLNDVTHVVILLIYFILPLSIAVVLSTSSLYP